MSWSVFLTHEQIHDDDRHDSDEYDEEKEGRGLVGQHHLLGVFARVVEEEIVELKLSDHHDCALNQGEAHVLEVFLCMVISKVVNLY